MTDTAPNGEAWNAFRRQMLVTQKWSYLDHAAVAPLPQPAVEAIANWARESAEEGDTVWSAWVKRIEQIRQSAARLIQAQPAEIAFVPNTTSGINLVAEGLDWQAGDNVVTLEDEFPSNQYPWLHLANLGVETRRVPTADGRLDLDQLEDACDERTRVVSISWVGFGTGYRHDLHSIVEIAHRHNALFFLDAIQALGVFPLDVGKVGVDCLAADGHKWLLGPEGAGIAYIREEHLERLRPRGLGWNSVVHAFDYSRIDLKLKPTAARYEGGSQNIAGTLGLGASLDLLMSLGIEAIAERILFITDRACARLESIGANVVSDRRGPHRSGIVAFDLPGKSPAHVRRQCLDHKVALASRAGHLRISPHAYNNEDDLDRLVEVLSNLR